MKKAQSMSEKQLVQFIDSIDSALLSIKKMTIEKLNEIAGNTLIELETPVYIAANDQDDEGFFIESFKRGFAFDEFGHAYVFSEFSNNDLLLLLKTAVSN